MCKYWQQDWLPGGFQYYCSDQWETGTNWGPVLGTYPYSKTSCHLISMKKLLNTSSVHLGFCLSKLVFPERAFHAEMRSNEPGLSPTEKKHIHPLFCCRANLNLKALLPIIPSSVLGCYEVVTPLDHVSYFGLNEGRNPADELRTYSMRCERSLTVSDRLLYLTWRKKNLIERIINYIDMSLIFYTREFNVKHLYTVFSPAKQCSYFNHNEWVIARGLIFPQVTPNEIHYHLRGWRRTSLSKVQSSPWWWRFWRCHTSTACNIEGIWLCLLNTR